MPSRQRRPLPAAIAFLCLAAPMLAAGAWAAEPAAPGQVIGYAKADRSGAAQTWDLPPEKPYLYIPSLPAHLGGRIEAIETGPEVGVVLFQSPYFTGSDRGCRPALGSARRPDLAWLGATASVAPAPEGQAAGQAAPDGPDAAGGYGSLIIYRADLGPPPGVLLLSRRATVGRRCENPAYNTVYNRIFVPVAEAPDAERCFDLVGDYPAASGTVPLDFVRSDRVVLLMPGDMAARYAPIRHDITVSLFDGLSCTGNSVNLNSRVARHRDSRLTDLGFRDRGRSVRLIYDYGNANAFLVRRAPEPASLAKAAAPKPAAPILAMQPIGDPAVGPSPGTAEASVPPSKPEPEIAPKAAPEANPEATAGALPETPAAPPAAPLMVPLAAPSPEPAVEAMAQPLAKSVPEPAPELAPAIQAKAAPAAPPATPTTTQAPSPPAGAVAPQQVVAAPATSSPAVPKLSPVVERPGPRVAALPATVRTFDFPVHEIYRLNHCLRWQSDCGEPAAAAWCRAQGFARALAWTLDPGIGADFPTVVMGDRRVCAQSSCDGFKTITCAP